jgi:hypothetical protein
MRTNEVSSDRGMSFIKKVPLTNHNLAPSFRNRQYVWTFQGHVIHDLSLYLEFDQYGRGSLVPSLINHMRLVPIPPETIDARENVNDIESNQNINVNDLPTDVSSHATARTMSANFSVSYLF